MDDASWHPPEPQPKPEPDQHSDDHSMHTHTEQPVEPVVTPEPGPEGKPLTYEETPVIETPPPQPQSAYVPQPPTPSVPPSPPRRGSFLKTIGTIILFGILFIVGIVLSSILRQFIPTGTPDTTDRTPGGIVTPTPYIGEGTTGTTPQAGAGRSTDNTSTWPSFSVINGLTRQSVSGISFRLPSDVLSPICDGSNCASQGTYLPGGTRFTIAGRGAGHVLRDYRGTQISDFAGKLFTTKPTTVAGRNAVEFTGDFSGNTVSGYAFSKMRGVMIDIDATHSLEINHFTPSGITADFAADDLLFDKIVGTLTFTGDAMDKGAVLTTPAPITTSSATPTQ